MVAWTSPSTGNPHTQTGTWTSTPTIHPKSRGDWSNAFIRSSSKPPRQDMEATGALPLEEEHRPPLVMLPYTEGVSEDVKRVCRKFGMKVVFRSGQSLRSMLTKVKDPLMIEKQAKVAYRVPCSCGEAYIGETVRRLETRVKEHRDACQKGALEKSALAEHAWMNHHPIKWEEVSVIDRARTAKELLVKEAIHIRLNHPSLNRDGGLELPRCWIAALKNTGSVSNQRPVAPTDSSSDST